MLKVGQGFGKPQLAIDLSKSTEISRLQPSADGMLALQKLLAEVKVKAISHSSRESSASYPCRRYRKRPRPRAGGSSGDEARKYQEAEGEGSAAAFKIAISPQARKYMKSLNKDEARMIKGHVNELRQDPYTPRPQCNIIKEKGKRPPLYRLRVGRHRAEYFIEGDTIFISKMFPRSGDFDYR